MTAARRVASVAAVAAVAVTAADASAKPGRLAGSLGIKVPKGAEAGVRAVTPRGKVVQKRIGVSLRPGQKRTHTSLAARKRKRATSPRGATASSTAARSP
jgi:hypothetical protein